MKQKLPDSEKQSSDRQTTWKSFKMCNAEGGHKLSPQSLNWQLKPHTNTLESPTNRFPKPENLHPSFKPDGLCMISMQ